MTKIRSIPSSDHFIRRALPRRHILVDHDDNVIGFDQSLFKYQTSAEYVATHGKSETSLSINHVEYFGGAEDEKLQQTLDDYRTGAVKNPGNCYFTKLNVGEFESCCHNRNSKPRIIHDGKTTKSHGGITQLEQKNPLLLEELAELAYTKMFRHKYSKIK